METFSLFLYEYNMERCHEECGITNASDIILAASLIVASIVLSPFGTKLVCGKWHLCDPAF